MHIVAEAVAGFTEDVLQHSSKLLTLRINMIDLAMQAWSTCAVLGRAQCGG